MARPKRPPHPILGVARSYVQAHAPDLVAAPIVMRTLDGPPKSPRYAVSVAECRRDGRCPLGVKPGDQERCPVLACKERRSLRLLLSRQGDVVAVIEDDIRWDRPSS